MLWRKLISTWTRIIDHLSWTSKIKCRIFSSWRRPCVLTKNSYTVTLFYWNNIIQFHRYSWSLFVIHINFSSQFILFFLIFLYSFGYTIIELSPLEKKRMKIKSDETDVSAIFFTSFFYLMVQGSFVEVEIGRQRGLRPPVNLQSY